MAEDNVYHNNNQKVAWFPSLHLNLSAIELDC